MAEAKGAVVIVGGTSGLGLRLAETYAARGKDVAITGREISRCAELAAAIPGPGEVTPIALDLAEPESIAAALQHVGVVDHLVLAAIERDQNSVAEYNVARAIRLVTLKLVGYTEVIHALAPRFGASAKKIASPGTEAASERVVLAGTGSPAGTLMAPSTRIASSSNASDDATTSGSEASCWSSRSRS